MSREPCERWYVLVLIFDDSVLPVPFFFSVSKDSVDLMVYSILSCNCPLLPTLKELFRCTIDFNGMFIYQIHSFFYILNELSNIKQQCKFCNKSIFSKQSHDNFRIFDRLNMNFVNTCNLLTGTKLQNFLMYKSSSCSLTFGLRSFWLVNMEHFQF